MRPTDTASIQRMTAQRMTAQRMTALQRTKLLLLASFGSIAAVLLAAQIVEYLQWRDVRRSVDLIDNDALASVRLIGRMGMDVFREHVLIDRHIVEQDDKVMTSLETQIATARDDYAAAAREYVPLASFEGEAARWYQLTANVAAVEIQATAALRLSRDNRDAEAHRVVIAMEPTFDAIARDLAALIAINDAAATRAQDRVAALEVRVLALRLALAAVILVVTFGVGLWATRRISRTEGQLRQQALELEAANRELDAFAGRVAHDLRGPLNTIHLAASMLAERVPEQAATTTILQRGIAQTTSLVHDLLELSRAGAPRVGPGARTEPVAASLEADLGAPVRGAGGALRIDLEPASICCTEGLLRELLWNLGENAVKYRRPDAAPRVEIVGRARRDGYEIRISDNGRGMSAEEAHRAFEPFFRGAETRAIPGTGLGLAIVRRVVESSGGTIAIDSHPGSGTTFVVELPLAPAPEPPRALPRDAAAPA